MRIVVSGYYGFGNLGDEALLAAIVRGVRRRLPEAELVVLSGDPAGTAREHGVAAVSRIHPRRVLTALRGARLLLSGSGSLLQDVTGPLSLPYYLGVVALARRLGVPVMIFAQGIGPLRRPGSRRLVRRVLAGVQAITVRDEASGRLLRALGVTGVPVEVTADPALTLDPPGGGPPLAEPYAAVSVRGRGLDAEGARRLGDALGRLAVETGLTLVFVPMHPAEDVAAARRVAAAAGRWTPRRELIEARPSLAEALRWLAGAQVVVGMRLHALVLGALGGAVPLGISYDPKVDAFLERLGLTPVAWTHPLPDGEALARRLRAAYEGRQRAAARLRERLPALRAAAERNFAWVEALVRGTPLSS